MANHPPTPGATGRSSTTYDAFSMLAIPSSSKPGSRSLTPSNPPRPQLSRSAAPASQGGSDAFSSLLGPSFTPSNNGEGMSLADRQAAAQREQQAKAARDREAKQNESVVWTGLDMFGQGSLNSVAYNAGTKYSPPSAGAADGWLFDKIEPVASSNSKPASSLIPAQLDDDWGLSDFAGQTQSSAKTMSRGSTREPISLFDALDDGDLLPDSFGESRSLPVTGEHDEEAEDDILGMLGKPVAPKTPSPPQPPSPVPSRERNTRAETSSPPPHLIGQIVEMGFSPQQARLALTSTDTGLDVQQALETLLSNGVGADYEPESSPDRPNRGIAELQDEEDGWEGRRRENSRVQRSVLRQTVSSSAPSSRTQLQSPSLVSGDIQERADKLLAQASEIGFNVFSRANTLWKDGKEKVQKVYEERAAKGKPVNDGRPRWMIDVPTGDDERIPRSNASGEDSTNSGFRDDDDIREQISRPQGRQEDARPNRTVIEDAPQAVVVKTPNLFGDESAVYVSPARRRPAPSRSISQTTASPALTTSPLTRKSQPSPSLRSRQTVSANVSAIASSNAHKAKGTDLYKLGQFANAEQAYSAALFALPANHLLLIPLHNNRALSRIKIGEHSGAIDDCTAVIAIIGADYNPSREAKVTRENEGASVDLGDALLKAFRRRAEAYEGHEKWELALKDWEAIIACEWSAKLRGDAFAGASRCRKMVLAEIDPPPRNAPAPRAAALPAVSNTVQDFEAVRKLRQANQALEEEEQTKANLKDSVDARFNVWKAGKEANVRALLASLETVLWPELAWQKVGLHELVTPSQVKIRYMKAIAKLHPDKINSSDTTIEQRMIANGVFAALNDAWIAFKQ